MTPISFDVHDVLNSLEGCVSQRASEFTRSVGVWFARRFCDQSPEDMCEIMSGVRPVLRRRGFDICDSEIGEQVGCDFCEDPHEQLNCHRAEVSMFPPKYGFDAELVFHVRINDDYTYGFDMPIKYCPMCGRRLDAGED